MPLPKLPYDRFKGMRVQAWNASARFVNPWLGLRLAFRRQAITLNLAQEWDGQTAGTI